MKRCPLKCTIYVLNVLGIYNLVFTRIELCAQWLRMTDYDRNLFKTATPKKSGLSHSKEIVLGNAP